MPKEAAEIQAHGGTEDCAGFVKEASKSQSRHPTSSAKAAKSYGTRPAQLDSSSFRFLVPMRGDKKDRGKSVISFDYGFTYMQGEDEQVGTCLYIAESETKAVNAVPVLAKGGVSLKQVTEETVRFSFATSSSQSIFLMVDGERSTRQILRAVEHCRAQLGLRTEVRTTGRGSTSEQWTGREDESTISQKSCQVSSWICRGKGRRKRGGSHVYPWSFRRSAWLMSRFRVTDGWKNFL